MTATADISDIGHTGVPYPATSPMHTTFHVTLQFSFHPIFRQFETALYGILHSILSLFTLYSPFPRTIRSFLYQFGQLSKPARPPPPPTHTHIRLLFSITPPFIHQPIRPTCPWHQVQGPSIQDPTFSILSKAPYLPCLQNIIRE